MKRKDLSPIRKLMEMTGNDHHDPQFFEVWIKASKTDPIDMGCPYIWGKPQGSQWLSVWTNYVCLITTGSRY